MNAQPKWAADAAPKGMPLWSLLQSSCSGQQQHDVTCTGWCATQLTGSAAHFLLPVCSWRTTASPPTSRATAPSASLVRQEGEG